MTIAFWSFFILGCLICATNFWLSFGRYSYLRFKGIPASEIRSVSGVPIFGSLILVLLLPGLWNSLFAFWCAIIFALLDTGGLHVFVWLMLCEARKASH